MNKEESLKAWGAFACVAIFWGTTYLAIRIGVESFPPLLFAGLRHFTAGSIILLFFALRKTPLPTRVELKHAFVMGMLMLVVGNGLLVWAERYISSGLAAIISSTFPFAVYFFSWKYTSEKTGIAAILGLLLGFAGQILIFYDKLEDFTNPQYRLGMAALFIAVICWGYGAVYRKRAVVSLNPIYYAGWQMVMGGAVYFPFALIKGEFNELHTVEMSGVWAFLYLVFIGSILAYGCFMYVLDKLPATVASMYSHINTIVAVLLGWAILNEPLSWPIALSTVFTLTGVYLVTRGVKKN